MIFKGTSTGYFQWLSNKDVRVTSENQALSAFEAFSPNYRGNRSILIGYEIDKNGVARVNLRH